MAMPLARGRWWTTSLAVGIKADLAYGVDNSLSQSAQEAQDPRVTSDPEKYDDWPL
jgi:hypothetical protein